MRVRNPFLPYIEKGKKVAVTLPEFEIAGVTLVVRRKVRQFLEPEAVVRTPEGTVFPLTRREYVLVMLPSRMFSGGGEGIASMSMYFTGPGLAAIRNCPKGSKLEVKMRTHPGGSGRVKMILRPACYSKQIEKKMEKINNM